MRFYIRRKLRQALSSIDKGFPGEDLDSDWPAYSGIAKTADGPVPIVCELKLLARRRMASCLSGRRRCKAGWASRTARRYSVVAMTRSNGT